MKCIKPILIGISSAGISMMGSIFRNSPANICTGMCRACGGVCLQPVLLMPAAGILALIIRRIRKHKYLSMSRISGHIKRLKMQVSGEKQAEQLH